MNRTLMVGLLMAMGLALAMRFTRLEERPMHNDEAVNAVKFGELLDHNRYTYDPNEHHGPSLLYATLPMARLSGANDFEHLTEKKLRLVTVLFGLGLLVLLPLIPDALGRNPTLWPPLFPALSPPMSFYTPSYLHDP